MPRRLFTLLALAVALSVTGSAIVSLAELGPAPVDNKVAPLAQAPAAAPAIPVLPTVVVHPDPTVPTLATITVRPARSGPETARLDRAGNVDQPLPLTRIGSVATLPGGGFDMPYYSFAKTLRRANKE